MRNLTNKTIVFVVFFFGFISSSRAETPYTATSRFRLYKILEGGTRQLDKESVIRDGRDTAGNRYTNQIGYGKENVSLWIKSSGDFYQVDPVRKTKHLLTKLSKPPGVLEDSAIAASANTAKQDVFYGVPCLRLSRLGTVKGVNQEIGFTCISQEHSGLTVYMESPVEINGHKFLAIIDQLVIQTDVRPPSEWFSIPDDYVDRKPKVAGQP